MKCKICNSNNVEKFSDNIIQCNNCSNFFRINVSDDIYSKYVRKLPMPKFFDSKFKACHHLSFLKENVKMDNLKSILEIGPGDGELIKLIRKSYPKIKITVIEPGKEFISRLNEIHNINVINSFIEDSNLESKFDLIILSHVLEHFLNPTNTLKFIFDYWMDKNSKLYIDIPNADYELHSKAASLYAPDIHLSFFSPLGIIFLLKQIGFDNSNITGNIYSTLPKNWILRREQMGKIISDTSNWTFRIIGLKILNRVSLYFYSMIKYLGGGSPPEKQLTRKDKFFNNIAIIATKY